MTAAVKKQEQFVKMTAADLAMPVSALARLMMGWFRMRCWSPDGDKARIVTIPELILALSGGKVLRVVRGEEREQDRYGRQAISAAIAELVDGGYLVARAHPGNRWSYVPASAEGATCKVVQAERQPAERTTGRTFRKRVTGLLESARRIAGILSPDRGSPLTGHLRPRTRSVQTLNRNLVEDGATFPTLTLIQGGSSMPSAEALAYADRINTDTRARDLIRRQGDDSPSDAQAMLVELNDRLATWRATRSHEEREAMPWSVHLGAAEKRAQHGRTLLQAIKEHGLDGVVDVITKNWTLCATEGLETWKASAPFSGSGWGAMLTRAKSGHVKSVPNPYGRKDPSRWNSNGSPKFLGKFDSSHPDWYEPETEVDDTAPFA